MVPRTGLSSAHPEVASASVRRFAIAAAALLGLVVAGCAANEPAPGLARKTAVVDGRNVTYVRSGSGRSVVLESGLGDGADPWQQVLAGVEGASAFAYDRAGYGGSATSAAPRDGGHLVEELRRTLQVVGLPGPYVLVGHSLGGQLVLLYARLHPDEVAGLVLVDARPAAFTERCLATLGEVECVLSASTLAQLPPAMRAEYDAAPATAAQLLAAAPLPPLPVVVLSSGKGTESAAFRSLWASMQDELAVELSATHRTVAGAGHYVQRDAPAEVVRAIDEVLLAAR